MSIKKRALPLVMALAWVVPALLFAQARGKLVAKVLDPEGKPIQGVLVTVTSPQIPGYKDVETTDKRGVFSVEFDKVNVDYHYRFDKLGYQSMETSQRWEKEGGTYIGEGTQVLSFTMKPGQSAIGVPAAAAPPASTSNEAIDAFNAALTAYNARDFKTAETKWKEALTHDPKLVQAWEALATVEVDLGNNQEAVQDAEKAIALGSRKESVYLARWQAYRNLKDKAKAEAALKDLQAIGKQTEQAKKVHNEGVEALRAKNYEVAYEKFQDALKLDPELTPSQIGLAEAGLQSGHAAEAEAAAADVLKTDPKNAEAIKLRYNAALALGDKAKLADALVGLASVDPDVARNGLLKLAFDAYDKNDMPQAKSGFEKVVEVAPNYALPYFYLGLIEVGENDTAGAKSNFERFLQLAPNDKEANDARQYLEYLKNPKK